MLTVSTKPEYSVYGFGACSACCMVRLEAPNVEAEQRAPISLSLVLDRSGSMSGQKLKLVKNTITFLLRQLRAKDYVGVVSYDDEVKEEAALRSATEEHRSKTDATVSSIYTGGCTNLSGGLFKGLQQLLAACPEESPLNALLADVDTPRSAGTAKEDVLTTNAAGIKAGVDAKAAQDGVRACFLFTDGHANRGITKQDELVAKIKKVIAKAEKGARNSEARAPPSISTFGFGSDHSEDLLNAIAGTAGGTYYFIQKAEDIPTAFAEALGGLLSVFAQTVELTLTPKNGAEITKVHTGFATQTKGDSTVVTVPDIYAEEVKNLIVDMSLPKCADDGADQYLDVKVTYLNVPSAAFEAEGAEFTATRAAKVPEDLNPDEEVVAQRLRLSTAAALADAVRLADQGQLHAARDCLVVQQQCIDSLRAESDAARGAQRALRYDVVATLQGFSSDRTYQARGKKFAMATTMSHATERSNVARYSSPSVPHGSASPQSVRPRAARLDGNTLDDLASDLCAQAQKYTLERKKPKTWAGRFRSIVNAVLGRGSSQSFKVTGRATMPQATPSSAPLGRVSGPGGMGSIPEEGGATTSRTEGCVPPPSVYTTSMQSQMTSAAARAVFD